jgi:ABC-type branched-subunit amino acid transport system ATPase component
MLEVRGLCKHFGGIRAVDECSFSVKKGSITALIGPNGAGKTTAFNCISKSMRPTAGEVWLEGTRIDTLPAHQVTRRGLSRTFQITRNLEDLSVLENLVVQSKTSGFRALFGPAISSAERDNMNLVMTLSHKVVVMAHGQVIAEGSPGEVQSDPEVLSAYLGVSRPASAEAGNG